MCHEEGPWGTDIGAQLEHGAMTEVGLRQGHALEDRVKKSFYKKVTSDQGFEG